MAYTRVNWEDLPSTNTPRNATNLNKMDAGIKDNDDRIKVNEDKLSGNSPMGSIVVDDVNCKNLFGVNSTAIRSGVTSIYNGSTLTLNGTSTGEDFNEDYTLKMVRLSAGTYTFTIQAISGTKTGSQSLVIRNIDDNSSILDTNFTGNYAYTFTLNQDTNINVLIYYLASGNVFTNYVMNIQIEEGDTATSYTPYKKIIKEKNGYVKENTTFYANDFKCRNLFNKNNVNKLNAYFNESTPTITSNSSNRTLYIPCKPNTTYTITIPDGTGAYAIGYTSTLPALNTSVSGVSNTSKTITTDANAKYLVMRYFQTAQATITEQQALDGIQLEIGSEATPYTPYKNFENEEIYSTNEIKIGKWIDGKDLYRKVITATPNIANATTSSSFDIDIANVDQVFIKDTTKIADTSSSGYVYTFPFLTGSVTIGGYISVLTNKLTFYVRKTNNVGFYAIRLVLEYTKTTD